MLTLLPFGRLAVALKLISNCSHYLFQFIACEQPLPVWRHWKAVMNLTADVSIQKTRRLRVEPLRVIVFEDALAGVEAGKRGHFGRVVGMDRGRQSMALRQHGADVGIKSLQIVLVKGR